MGGPGGLSGSDSFPACVLKKPAFVREDCLALCPKQFYVGLSQEPWALLTARSPQNREAVAKALTAVALANEKRSCVLRVSSHVRSIM